MNEFLTLMKSELVITFIIFLLTGLGRLTGGAGSPAGGDGFIESDDIVIQVSARPQIVLGE